ncbi:MAG TPA: hypothetical protein VGV85_05665 [Longimicrobiaceae bacterium]|nr:hypothetical protein [Longimicrobiaceae bacterium]
MQGARTMLNAGGAPGVALRLAGLLKRGGTTLFLHVRHGSGPLEIVLVPSDGHALRVELEDAAAEARVDETAPDGAYVGPADRDVPLLHHLPQSEPCVLAFAVDARGVRRCTVRFPGFVSHAAVLVDSRVVEEALPLEGTTGPVVLPVRRR